MILCWRLGSLRGGGLRYLLLLRDGGLSWCLLFLRGSNLRCLLFLRDGGLRYLCCLSYRCGCMNGGLGLLGGGFFSFL